MALITLGCSITCQLGWKDALAGKLSTDLINLSESAGSNTLQIQRLHEHIINNSLTDEDIIIWQVTAPRFSLRLKSTDNNVKIASEIQIKQFLPKDQYHSVTKSVNFFDNLPRIDLLCNSSMIDQNTKLNFDSNQDLETLLATLILLKKAHKKLLVFLGWDSAIEHKEKFFTKLSEHNVDCVKESLVDWVKSNNLSMSDGRHPSLDSYVSYGLTVLAPKLQDLGWAE